MTDADERERIRERKRQELLERAAGDAAAEPTEAADPSADAPSEPVHVEGADHLDELAGKYDVVLVDFYADWCGPCQMLEPTVEAIASDTAAAVAKVDVDGHPDLAGRAGVRGVPTLVLYAGGEQVEQLVGVQDEAKLRQLVERYA